MLRLDVATIVELSTGENTSGQSVAQAILSDGRLWGRILTSTGVNLGGGGMVAGVRGTSVSVIKEAGVTYISIPHSTKPTAAANVICTSVGVTHETQMSPGDILSDSSTCITTTPGTSSLYLTSDWVRDNTRKDLIYLDPIATPTTLAEVAVTDPSPIDIRR